MAKLKTKHTVFDTMATEVQPGEWQWETGKFVWRWLQGRYGINLLSCRKDVFDKAGGNDQVFQPSISARKLEEAVMFSHGFEGGYYYAGKEAGSTAESDDQGTNP